LCSELHCIVVVQMCSELYYISYVVTGLNVALNIVNLAVYATLVSEDANLALYTFFFDCQYTYDR